MSLGRPLLHVKWITVWLPLLHVKWITVWLLVCIQSFQLKELIFETTG